MTAAFIASGPRSVHLNSTVTSSSSQVLTSFGCKNISLVINIVNAPTGGLPSITFSIQEVDPGDQTTVINSPVTGAPLTGAGTQVLELSAFDSGAVKVSWTVTGSTPSFTGVYSTLEQKVGEKLQSVSGTVTANIGTSGSLALDATLTGGTVKSIVRGGSKGATTPADVTSTAEGTDHQSLDVQIYHGGAAKDPTQIRALTSSDVVTAAQSTAANLNATVVGTLTNDFAAPSTNNVGALTARATASPPSYSEGNQTLLSTDLDGSLRITGSISASNPSVGDNDDTSPSSSTQIGGSDGTNLQALRAFDSDTGGGTEYVLGTIIRKSSSGGSVEAGTPADPFRVDPTGTTAQPITDNAGSLTVDNAGTFAIQDSEKIADNTPFTDGTSKVQPAGFVFDEVAGTALTENDAGAARMDSKRAIVNVLEDATTRGQRASVSAGGALKVDGSAATQPISGTVTANIGSSGALALDSTLTGGTSKAIIRGGAKGATAAADVTSTAEGTDHQAVDVQIYHGGVAKDPTQIRSLTSSDVVTAVQATASNLKGTVVGTLTNDNAVPSTNNVGALTVLATAAAPSYSEGNQALLSADLAGSLRITGSVSASNPSVGSNTAGSPASSTQIGGSDGTNLQALRAFDTDTDGGTEYVLGTVLRKSASGGSVEAGTALDPLRVDPTGTTAQPVTDNAGSLTVDNAGTFAVQDSQVIADNGPFTDGTSKVFVSGFIFDEVAGTALTENDAAAARVDSKRAIVSVLEDATTRGQRATVSAAGALKIDGSAVTQPVSGTVIANIGTSGSLALDATLTGGTAKSIVRGGTKGATTPADITSTAEGTDHQALDVQIYHGGAAKDPTQIRALTSSDVVTAAQATAANLNATVVGTLTNDDDVPSSNNIGALTARATAVAPSYSEGNQALLSTDLSGSLRITGSISASNPSVGDNDDSIPTSSTQIGGSDGTNLQALRAFDTDTAGGTEYVLGAVLRKSAGGGSVEAGTPTDPLRVDPTGSTAQPITDNAGSLTVDNAGTFAIQDSEKIADNTAFTDGASKVQPAGFIFDEVAGTALTENDVAAARVDSKRAIINVLEDATTRGQRATVSAAGALKVDGSAVTQPVSGTVTANIGSSGSLALDATLTGGTAKSIVRGGTKGATTPADVTSTAEGTDNQALDVQIYHGGAAKDPTQIRALTSSDVVTAVQATAANLKATVVGTLTNNNAAPSSTNMGALTAVATAVAPSYSEGKEVLLSTDLDGSLRVTGSISASNPSVDLNNASIPGSSTQIGGSDGTNLQAATVFDVDTGGGTQYVLGASLRKAASGGSVEAGTASDPLRVDPTGTTAQPVTDNAGSLTVDNNGTFAVQDSEKIADNNPFTDGTSKVQPAGFIFDEVAGTALTENDAAAARIDSKRAIINVLEDATTRGQRASISAGGALKVDGSAVIQPVSGTVTAAQATAASLNATVVGTLTNNNAAPAATNIGALTVRATAAAPSYSEGNQALLSTDLAGALRITGSISASNPSVGSNGASIPTSSTQVGGSDGTNLQALRAFDADTGGGTQYVLGTVLRKSASGGSVELGTSSDPIRTDPIGSASSAVTPVASSASSVTLLASNASRKMATFFNDSTKTLYIKFGATASTSSYTVQVSPSGYYEMPLPIYTGVIDGIWSAANGNARITELT